MFTIIRVCLIACLVFTGQAHAEAITNYRVIHGPYAKGGMVEEFFRLIRELRRERKMAVLDEECWSSCTFLTNLLKDGLLCATPGTKLYFHQIGYAELDLSGVRITSVQNYRLLSERQQSEFVRMYPPHVGAYIRGQGGLPVPGKELIVLASQLGIPTCTFTKK